MVHWWFIEARGEYAIWTGVGPGIGGPVMPVLELNRILSKSKG